MERYGFHTRKLGEITVFYTMIVNEIHDFFLKHDVCIPRKGFSYGYLILFNQHNFLYRLPVINVFYIYDSHKENMNKSFYVFFEN